MSASHGTCVLNLLGHCQTGFQSGYSFILPCQVRTQLLYILANASVVRSLNFSHSSRCVVVLVFICISSITNDLEHLFMLLIYQLYTLVMCLLTSIVHIFSWAIHPMIECNSSSYTSGIWTKTYSYCLNHLLFINSSTKLLHP